MTADLPQSSMDKVRSLRTGNHMLSCPKCGDEHSLKAHDELIAGEKECRRCHVVQPFDSFYRCKGNVSNGRQGTCKLCYAIVQQNYYNKHKARILAATRKRDAKNKRLLNWQNNFREKQMPEKGLARRRLVKAVQDGRIEKLPCQLCSDPRSVFHHTNGYDEPNWYVGMWLCRTCHAKVHRDIRLKAKEALREQLRKTATS